MSSPALPELAHTPVGHIPVIHSTLVRSFAAHLTRPLSFRLTQLRKLYWAIKDHEKELLEACKRDLGKPYYETYLTEINWCLNDIIFVCKNLESWAREEKAKDIPLMHAVTRPKIRKEPLGAVLVIGAFNFPYQLSLGPLVGAIAAGCTAVLKPSENAPYAAAMMQRIIAERLDSSAYTVVQGAIPETTALLDCKWDKIFYTGSATVGTIISKKAAETLTPVTLELGGRNPAIVTRNADMRLAARRLLWTKHMNAGQICVSQNYILIDKEVLPTFLEQLKVAIKDFYPNGVRESEDYGRIVNEKQWQRIKKMLDSTSGKILIGGTMDAETKYLEPTVVEVTDPNDSLLTEESFGPLIPVVPVSDLDEAIRLANTIHATPLGIYPFGSKAEVSKILDSTRSGGASINDGFYHASISTLEFGGVGDSGSGSYRGKASFDAFTHRRVVTSTPGWVEGLLSIRYPPYKGKMEKVKKMSEMKPDFDREGRVVKPGWLVWAFLLGGNGFVQGLGRWAVILAVVFGYRGLRERQSKL
ncbi:Hexadecenal dehydrogenase [Zalaria obscura]|uniref:Hexadecenal dehydrogenase n=1 Tax=Zalaria obscura TaxID=2024903 RepID=A0ACC3SQY4_9PEZI